MLAMGDRVERGAGRGGSGLSSINGSEGQQGEEVDSIDCVGDTLPNNRKTNWQRGEEERRGGCWPQRRGRE